LGCPGFSAHACGELPLLDPLAAIPLVVEPVIEVPLLPLPIKPLLDTPLAVAPLLSVPLAPLLGSPLSAAPLLRPLDVGSPDVIPPHAKTGAAIDVKTAR